MASAQDILLITKRLEGKVLVSGSNEFDTDYSGGSIFYENSTSIYLYENKHFRHERSSYASLSAGGFSISSGGNGPAITTGTWRVRSYGFEPYLVLAYQDETVFKNIALKTPFLNGIEYLDGEPWKRYRID